MRKDLGATLMVTFLGIVFLLTLVSVTTRNNPSDHNFIDDKVIESEEIRIWGEITDAESGKPVGATVIIGDEWDFTGVDGRFRTKVKPGLHRLKITKTFQKVIERCDKCGSALSVVKDIRTLLETEITVNSSNQRVDFNFEVKIPAEYK